MEPETDEIARAIDKAVGRAGGAVTALPDRCFCAAPLRLDDGLVLCVGGHVYALSSALPADVLEALAREDASG